MLNTSSMGIKNGLSHRAGLGNVAVDRIHQARKSHLASSLSGSSLSSAFNALPRMIGVSSPGNSYLSKQLPKLQLHQLDQLLVVHHVALVQKHHDPRNTHLTRQQNVLAGLGHRTVVGPTTKIAPSICAAP
jgi:hypothetical protein